MSAALEMHNSRFGERCASLPIVQKPIASLSCCMRPGIMVGRDERKGLRAACLCAWAAGAHQVPYTFVRGCSDYLYPAPTQTSPGVWGDNPNSPAEQFNLSYPFAIRTTSTVLLTAFQLRCRAAGNSVANCGYTLPHH